MILKIVFIFLIKLQIVLFQIVGQKTIEDSTNGPVKQQTDHHNVKVKYLVDTEQTNSTPITDIQVYKNSLKQWPSIKPGS